MPSDGARRSRRALLASAAGGVAALAAAQLAKPAAALAVEEPVYRNTDNTTTAITACRQATDDTGAIEGIGKGRGWGVKGASGSGPGVLGTAELATMAGVVGLQGDTTNSYYQDVLADPLTEELASGVYGYSVTGSYPNGVWGESPTDAGCGLFGEGAYGVLGFGYAGVVGVGDATGVHGHGGDYDWPDEPAKTGVLASCVLGGVALEVRGPAKFSRSGRILIAKGKSYVDVDLRGAKGGLSGLPLCFATLMTYRSGYYVAAVRMNYPIAGKLRIYLNKALLSATYVAWFVVN